MAKKNVDSEIRHDFETVDNKIAEAEFFLQKMAQVGFHPFEFNCYFSAYLSAARTTTLALQRFGHIPNFSEWYEVQRARMKSNGLAKLLLDLRNAHVHGGPYAVTSSVLQSGKVSYSLHKSVQLQGQAVGDVVSICREHFVLLLRVIYDCYVKFGVHIDPQQYFTRQNFAAVSGCIEDAEVQVWGWVCSELIDDGYSEDDRWHELRAHVGECTINHLFYSYLGRPTPQPEMPDHFQDFEYTPEEKGWIHAPAGFDSVADYWVTHGMGGFDGEQQSS